MLAAVPEADRETLIPLEDRDTLGASVLGMWWSPRRDDFRFRAALTTAPANTKRAILSVSARLFDPLGWLAPIVVVAKLLLQDLWIAGLDWDQPLPSASVDRWRKFHSGLRDVAELRLRRWTGWAPRLTSVEIHGFCDASERAYAAVVYLVTRGGRREPQSRLLAARTKVAQVRRVTLPRLELCGAHLLARLVRAVVDSTRELEDVAVTCWTDSAVVLAWVAGHPTRWKTFVANRVAAISEMLPAVSWRHVPTSDNPADCASRGTTPIQLRDLALWWRGPAWLGLERTAWPGDQATPVEIPIEESRAAHGVALTQPEDWVGVTRASSLRRAVRVMAYVLRLARRAPGRQRELAAPEMERARCRLVGVTQQTFFKAEIEQLQLGRNVNPSSPLRPLMPYADDSGLIRVGGRLHHSLRPLDERHPLLLPRDSRLTTLIIREAHEQSLHGGTQLTLTLVRRQYWVPSGRSLVRRVIHHCVVCARHRGVTMAPLMAPLPPGRVTPNPPFTNTGVDYAGPVTVRASRGRGQRVQKAYIAVFVCFSTRAMHLELVSDYTTAAFLAAFRRFTARRGLPAVMHSDQGTTFVGAGNELRAQLKRALGTEGTLARALAARGTEWKYAPPAAPHFGGLWEAGVRAVKHHLRRVVGEQHLTYEEFATLLAQIEACLNSRPLSPMTDDPEDLRALTPGHFLVGRPLLSTPEPELREVPTNRLSRWQLMQQMTEHFWERWSSEYLQQLQTRQKWQVRQEPPPVGQLVVIKDPRLPPASWTLGRIEALVQDSDGQIRVARVRTADTILTRPLEKLVRLPVEGSGEAPDSPPGPRAT